MQKLSGKVALVTGAGRGLGRGIAMCLARVGVDVVIADIMVENARETAGEVKKLGRRSLALAVDVADSGQVRAMVDECVKQMGTLDIAVNNAGVLGTSHHQ